MSDHVRFNLKAKKSRNQIVQLVNDTNYLATWQINVFDPRLRLEYEGLPVPVSEIDYLFLEILSLVLMSFP